MYSTQNKLIFACDFDQEQFKTAFAKSLKEIRKYTGLSLRELSRMTDINSSLLSKYENGVRIPPTETLMLLADYYNVSMDYIMKRTDRPEVNK